MGTGHCLESARVTGWVLRAAVVLGAAAVGFVMDRPPAQPARMTTTTASRVIARIGGTFLAISGRSESEAISWIRQGRVESSPPS